MFQLTNITITSRRLLKMHLARNQTFNQTAPDINSARLLSQHFQINAVILSIVSIIIIVANMLVVATFISTKKIRKRHANVLIFSQSLADIATGLIFIPVYLLETFFKQHITLSYIIGYILYLSLFNLLGLALDRLLALWNPLFHHKYVDLKTTIIGIFVVWVIPLILTLIPITYQFSNVNLQAQIIYLAVNWCFLVFLCTLLTSVYILLTYKATQAINHKNMTCANKTKEQSIKSVRKELRVIHLFGLLLFFFILAYLPLLYMNFCDFMALTEYIPDELELVSLYSLVLNSVVNPILCIFLKRDYYQFVSSMISKRRNVCSGRKQDENSKARCKATSITSSSNTSSTFRSKSSRKSSRNEVFI